MINRVYHWYALKTRYQAEFKCVEQLRRVRIDSFTPWQYNYRRWSDRTKRIQQVLFPQYIFGKISCLEFGLLNSCEPRVTIVKRGGYPDPVPEEIIYGLQRLKDSVDEYKSIDHPLQKGELIEIIEGPFMGSSAEVVRINGNKRAFVRVGESGIALIIPISQIQLRKTLV